MHNPKTNTAMKRLFFLLVLCFSAVCAYAQADTTCYHAFVERGKMWCVHSFNMGSAHTITNYHFSQTEEPTVAGGHEYTKMYAKAQDGMQTTVGLFREAGQRVYLYDADAGREYLIYDFTLKEGDEFEPEYGDYTHCKVKTVGEMWLNGERLKTITFEANDRQYAAAVRVEVEWIEGIGHPFGPLAGLFSGILPNSWAYYTAYVLYNQSPYFLPLPFEVPAQALRGCQLRPIPMNNAPDGTSTKLEYELVPDPEHDSYALHVYGQAPISCSPNQYIYCMDECTDDLNVHILLFQIEELPPYADCIGPSAVDLYFRFFQPEIQYIAVDKQGEHPVPVNNKHTPYRPFIEEGKVWRVGWHPALMPTPQRVDTYYFEGDTVISNLRCKKMSCLHGPTDQRWGGGEPWTEYVGAVYEEAQRVYCVLPNHVKPLLLYDFASAVGDTVGIYSALSSDMQDILILKRTYNDADGYKGTSTQLAMHITEEADQEHEGWDYRNPEVWMEGVGSYLAPLHNVMPYDWAGYYYSLITCTIGDEVIYGRTSIGSDVKKQWLDFTHVTKPRPKAPERTRQRTEAQDAGGESLTGEYSESELLLNLKPLSGPYTVTLTDEAGREVYRKVVQTSNVAALNTDLTRYADGTYYLLIENNAEQFAATITLPLISVGVRELPNSTHNPASTKANRYDLTGRRLATPPAKGLYIEDGHMRVAR